MGTALCSQKSKLLAFTQTLATCVEPRKQCLAAFKVNQFHDETQVRNETTTEKNTFTYVKPHTTEKDCVRLDCWSPFSELNPFAWRLVGEQLLHKTRFGLGKRTVLKGGAAGRTTEQGKKNRKKRLVSPAGTVATQGSAVAEAPFRKGHPRAGRKPWAFRSMGKQQ